MALAIFLVFIPITSHALGVGKLKVLSALNEPLNAEIEFTSITEKELKMAQSLIESMSVAWEPEKYRDEYRTAVMELIEQKAQHKEVAGKPAPAAETISDGQRFGPPGRVL